jgi:hypothetical protein
MATNLRGRLNSHCPGALLLQQPAQRLKWNIQLVADGFELFLDGHRVAPEDGEDDIL